MPVVCAWPFDGHTHLVKWMVAFDPGGVGVGSWLPNANRGVGVFARSASNETAVNDLEIRGETGFEAFSILYWRLCALNSVILSQRLREVGNLRQQRVRRGIWVKL